MERDTQTGMQSHKKKQTHAVRPTDRKTDGQKKQQKTGEERFRRFKNS